MWGFSQFHSSAESRESQITQKHTDQPAAYLIREPEDPLAKWLDPVAIFTGLLFIVTTGLTFATYGLFDETKQLASDTREASAKALEASTKTIKTMETNAELELRAHVGVVSGAVCLTKMGDLFVHLSAQNQGRTPAHDVRQFVSAEIRDFGNDAPGAIQEPHGDNWVMTPGTSWPVRFPDRVRRQADGTVIVSGIFTPQDITKVLEDKKQFVVWGKITYRDVFDKKAIRESFFCYRNGREIPPNSAEDRMGIAIKWEPEPTPEGNHST